MPHSRVGCCSSLCLSSLLILSVSSAFYLGDPIDLLLTFTNHASTAFNLTYIQAFLHSPYDYKYYIQNVSNAVIPSSSFVSYAHNALNLSFSSFICTIVTLLFGSCLFFFLKQYTAKYLGLLVEPDTQVSVQYTFFPDPQLDPFQFRLSAALIYNSTVRLSSVYGSVFVLVMQLTSVVL